MVGLVGSSNNPVSGMAIATLLISTILLKVSGDTGAHGMVSAITIGSIICVIAAIAGDTSQDLKTGYILGATPKKQQIGELVGAIISALTIGGVLILLDSAWGFGSKELAAPQATLMKLVTEGVMNGNLPWSYVFIGAACTVLFELLGLPSLAVAIGIYLPIELTAPIMLGGVLRRLMDKKNKTQSSESSKGVLFCSGLIAGEGLMGVLLAILTVAGIADKIGLGANIFPTQGSNVWPSSGNLHLWYPEQKTPATEWEARIDHLYNEGSFTNDFNQAKKIWDEYQSIILEQCPIIYLVSMKTFFALQGKWDISNFFYDNMNGAMTERIFLSQIQ